MNEGPPKEPSQLCVFAELRKLLISMEEDLGLRSLSRIERDLYHACRDVGAQDGSFASSDIKGHRLLAGVPPATFHRALKRLLEAGFIDRADQSAVKNYVLPRR